MRITNLTGFSRFDTDKKQNNTIQMPSFKQYKLIDVFPDPNYKTIKDYVYELSNKIKVIIIPKPGKVPTFIKTVVRVGSMNEKESERGIAHANEHSVFLKSAGLKENAFRDLIDKLGFDYNAMTHYDYTGYVKSGVNLKMKQLAKTMKPYSLLVKKPEFPQNLLNKEEKVIIEEIKTYEDIAEDTQSSNVLKLLYGINSNADDLILGEKNTVRNLRTEQFKDFHSANYVPNRMEIHAIGNIAPEKLIKIIDKHFDTPDFRPKEEPQFFSEINPIQKTKIEVIKHPRVKFPTVQIGFIGPKNADIKESIATDALLTILADGEHARLNKKLLTLNLDCGALLDRINSLPQSPQNIIFKLSPDVGQEQTAINCIKQVFSELKISPVTQDELDIAKKSLINTFSTSAETSEDLSEMLTEFFNGGGIDAYKNYLNNVKNLTVEDVNSVAQKYIDTKRAAVSVFQSKKAKNSDISFEGRYLVSPKNMKKYDLANNIKLLVNRQMDKNRASVLFKIETDEVPLAGVNHILGAMLDKATSKYSEEEFSLLQARLGVDETAMGPLNNGLIVSSNIFPDDILESVKIIKQIFFDAKLDKKSFDKTIKEFKLALKQNPVEACKIAEQYMYKNHPEGINSEDILKNLKVITLEDVKEHYNALLKNGKVIVSVTAPILENSEAEKALVKELSEIDYKFQTGFVKEQPFILPKSNRIDISVEAGRTQHQISKLYHIAAQTPRELVTARLLDYILDYRLDMDLRESQDLAYSAHSSFVNRANFGEEFLEVETGIYEEDEKTLSKNLEKVLDGFDNNIKALMENEVTEEELKTAKEGVYNAYVEDCETASDENDLIMTGLKTQYGETFYNKILYEMGKVTTKDLQNAAQKYFSTPSVTSIITNDDGYKLAKKLVMKDRSYSRVEPSDKKKPKT